jgi:hypothetical protein
MRIIHNIGPKKTQQMTASGFAYRGKVGTEDQWQGWHCEVVICSKDGLSGAEQALEIEGDGDDLIDALEEARKMLIGYRELLRKGVKEGENVNPPHARVNNE